MNSLIGCLYKPAAGSLPAVSRGERKNGGQTVVGTTYLPHLRTTPENGDVSAYWRERRGRLVDGEEAESLRTRSVIFSLIALKIE